MTYKTHIVGGIVLAGVIHQHFFTLSELQFTCYYIGATVGSLLPDIDHPQSFISQQMRLLHYPFQRLGHRKGTHSLLALAIVFEIMYLLFGKNYVGLGVVLGYLSHLLLDMLNPRGVPLLYPFTKYKYKIIGKIHTGERGEEIIYFILMVGLLFLVIKGLSQISFLEL